MWESDEREGEKKGEDAGKCVFEETRTFPQHIQPFTYGTERELPPYP